MHRSGHEIRISAAWQMSVTRGRSLLGCVAASKCLRWFRYSTATELGLKTMLYLIIYGVSVSALTPDWYNMFAGSCEESVGWPWASYWTIISIQVQRSLGLESLYELYGLVNVTVSSGRVA